MSQTYRITEIKWDKGCLDLMDPLDAEKARLLPSEVTFVFSPDGNWGGLRYNVRKTLEADGYGCRVLSFKVNEVTGQSKRKGDRE